MRQYLQFFSPWRFKDFIWLRRFTFLVQRLKFQWLRRLRRNELRLYGVWKPISCCFCCSCCLFSIVKSVWDAMNCACARRESRFLLFLLFFLSFLSIAEVVRVFVGGGEKKCWFLRIINPYIPVFGIANPEEQLDAMICARRFKVQIYCCPL